MLYIVGVVLLLAVSPVVATWLAIRAEHLVVLHWDRIGYFFLEHQHGGRYETIRPALAARAVARYAHRASLEAIHAAPQRVRGWAHAHIPRVLSAKV